jgi:hypothetical protein
MNRRRSLKDYERVRKGRAFPHCAAAEPRWPIELQPCGALVSTISTPGTRLVKR